MIPGQLQKLGFKYNHDLLSGLSAWKQSSQLSDFD
jgi:hypothetical protein